MTAATPSRPTSALRLLGALAVATFGVSLFQSLVSPVLAVFEQRLDVGVSAATWLVTAYLLSLAVLTPIIGRLGDLLGRRRVLIAVLAISLLGTAIAAVADSLPLLLVGRILQGAGGGVFPLSFALVREHLPPERVAMAIGVLSSLLGAGAGFGIAIAGAIVDGLGVRALFWIPALLLVVALPAVRFWVPAGGTRTPGRIDWGSAALLSGALASALAAISVGPAAGWLGAPTLGLLAAGVVLGAVWWRYERRSSAPFVEPRVFRARGVGTGNVVGVLINLGLFAAFLLLPRMATAGPASGVDLDLTPTVAGVLMVPLSALMICVAPFAGRLESRVGPRPLMAAGSLIAAGGFGLVLAHLSVVTLAAASALVGLGMGFAYGTVTVLVARAVPPGDVGAATGVVTMTRTVGGAVSAQVVGALIALSATAGGIPQESGFEHACVFAALALLAAAAAALAAPGRDDAPPRRVVVRPRAARDPGSVAPVDGT